VNGIIWPKADVERRHYRLRLLNGTDSRFLVVRFRQVAGGATDLASAGAPLPFYVVGSDQGLAASATQTDTLVFEPGGRYDVVFDFSQVPANSRIIMENIGGDAPFGGDFGDALDTGDFFPNRQTDRIMAFDVVLPLDETVSDGFDPAAIGHFGGVTPPADNVRKVALFEGNDEYGRLQPLLGVAAPTDDAAGYTVDGAIGWHSPTTENPATGDTEEWEIYNATGDAHPVHLHLVHFEVLGRQEFAADLIPQPVLQHNGETGIGFKLENIALGNPVGPMIGYVENAPKDMVTALPGQVTRIKATFDRPGRYVWHCHILSHEDHEMMRVLHVGPEAPMYAKAASSQRAAFATAGTPTASFALEQNYPNPFNPSTTIRFSLPAATQVRLEVFDMLGRRVAKLVDGEKSAGAHEVSFNARRLSSGTYVYRLTAGKQTVTKRMYLLK
jgi:FtsP/CotA-like multicopper oxidase with cupredoxin domain